ncbi:helix-turn-helix domain-containing protein [Roseospira visakhapatnamensis]|uniref:Transcriptional regulator with XRE-family HTH domain n=1 Tax=Roseospira visakhapatnamensis TaxID=390880 RepID=A0A7W6RHR6_9PROT|nr:helix-turn-helix transcriptional regulator [Roseospira visakhapatnamensis]MBB4268123.1 transcriptional regulator with XRE-family HTH domain [Roseospira visakhapatnamensis]
MATPPNRIREWREVRGLSRRALAELIGCHESQIVKLEAGERSLNTRWMSRLALALEVAAADLLPEQPDTVAPPATADGAMRMAIELIYRRMERRPTKFEGLSAAEFADECLNLARDLRALREAQDRNNETDDNADGKGEAEGT